jgi:hypothetical protein
VKTEMAAKTIYVVQNGRTSAKLIGSVKIGFAK